MAVFAAGVARWSWSSQAVLAALAITVGASHARAQSVPAAPQACNLSAATTLLALHDAGPVASAISLDPPTLWVLYADRGAQGAGGGAAPGESGVQLLQAAGIETRRPTIHLFAAGAGRVGGPALVASRDAVTAGFTTSDDALGVFVHSLHGDVDRTTRVATNSAPDWISLAGVGTNALLAWSDRGHAVRSIVLDPRGETVGTAQSWSGRYRGPVAVSGASGSMLATNAGGIVMAQGADRAHPSPAGVSAGGSVAALAASSAAWGTTAAFVAGGHAHVAVLGESGRSSARVVGDAASARHVQPTVAIATTAWGAVVAWTNGGVVTAAAVSAAGEPVGAVMPLTEVTSTERAQFVAAAGWGSDAMVVWTASGVRARDGSLGSALRMVRIGCQ